MKLADWVSAYAALVATAVAVWQGITYWQDRRPKLLLRNKTTFDLVSDGSYEQFMEAFERGSAELFAGVMRLEFTIVNVGRVKVHLSDMTLQQTEPLFEFDLNNAAAFPRWIEPGEAIVIVPGAENMAGVDLTAAVRVCVATATGQEFYDEIRGFSTTSAKSLRSAMMDEAYLNGLQAALTVIHRQSATEPVVSSEPPSRPGTNSAEPQGGEEAG